MKLVIALLLVLVGGCAPTWQNVDRATLVVSTAALACDWAQTRSAAAGGWHKTMEANPIMGSTPSTGTVDIYFASTAVVNATVWMLLPRAWRSVIPGVVIGAQVSPIVGNVGTTHTVCGYGRS